jgi:mannobiose 2-epimerase
MTVDLSSIPRGGLANLHSLAPEFDTEMERIAAWWLAHAVDNDNGGYFGEVDLSGAPIHETPRSVILIARILWFFSAAAKHGQNQFFDQQAERACDYLLSAFIDSDNGGVFWAVDREGRACNTRKQAYAQAFAIYGLAAFHRLTEDAKAIDTAYSLFGLLEKRFHDHAYGGYWEAFSGNWSPIADMRLSDKDNNTPKSMNTHLHIMEAYAELYRARPNAALKAALRRIVELHLDRIMTPCGQRLRLFFSREWEELSHTVSFGHDIEAAWLLCDAAETLGEAALTERARRAAVSLAEEVLRSAVGGRGDVFYEKDLSTGRVERARVWWVQAEAMVGFMNAFELTKDKRFADAVRASWSFIRRHVIAPDGEWRGLSDIDKNVEPRWAGPWKACYHNGRSMIEMSVRVRRQEGIDRFDQ